MGTHDDGVETEFEWRDLHVQVGPHDVLPDDEENDGGGDREPLFPRSPPASGTAAAAPPTDEG